MKHTQVSKPASPRLFFCLLVFLASLPGTAFGSADPNHFPVFDVIKANVSFWEDVYSQHSVNTAIIHDQNDLSRIYTTVSLIDKSIPGAAKQNSIRIKKAKQYYAGILKHLASGRPRNNDEKKIAALFGKQGSAAVYKDAAENIRAQTGLRERFAEGVVRSGAYMSRLKQIFREHGLPQDLAYLPHVESSFNPKAFSKFGAAGMWQFTRSTGKQFLRVDYIVDERRDPLIAADAAAKLLKSNYSQLGSWPLALTAYNYGAAGMKRALNEKGSYQKIFRDYRKGYFKFASKNFYSEFLAAVNVAKKLERSGTIAFDKPVSTVSVIMPAYADSIRLCSYLGIDEATLRQFNPSLRDPVFEGTKYIPRDYRLKLPYRFKSSSLLAGAPSSIFYKQQKRSQFYQVRPGDTAGAIALAHNISLSELVNANQLNRKAMVRIGQNLRIPPSRSQKLTARASVLPASFEEVTLKDSKKNRPGVQIKQFQEDAAVSGNLKVSRVSRKGTLVTGTVEVQPDESIGIYADWLKITPESIRLTNNISRNRDVQPGQKVTLEFLNVSVEKFETTRFDFHQETQEDFFNSYSIVGVTTYQVLKGDTIWDICYNKFDLPLWLLKKYNDKLDFNRLDPTSRLQIPVLKEI